MNRHVHFRLLALLSFLLAVAVGLSFLIHAGQMRRLARNLREQANQAEEAGQRDRALRCFERYLVFAPDDNAARARCGELVEHLAINDHERWRALDVYEQVLYREPSRQDIRGRLARLALRLGWTNEAQAHLRILLRDQPGQGELEFLLGECQEAAGEFAAAADSYRDAVRHDPHQVNAYLRLAQLFHARLDQPEQAGRVLDELVRHNGQSAEAHLVRAVYRMRHGSMTEAGRDLERARALAPEDARILLLSADREQRLGQWDEARRHLHKVRDLHPRTLDPYLALAVLELRCRHNEEAVACLRQGLSALPDQPELLLFLAQTLLQRGDEQAVEKMIQHPRRPGSPPGLTLILTGQLQVHRRQWTRARQTLEEATRTAEGSPALASRVHLLLADTHAELGDSDRQRESLQKAIALDPTSAPARLALAEALRRAGRIDDALEQYREAILLPRAPDECWIALGRLLIQRNRSLPPRKRRWVEVEQVLERARRLPTLETPLAVLRAELLVEQGHPEEAQSLLEKTSAAHPDRSEAWTALANLAALRREPKRAAEVLAEARGHASDRVAVYEVEIALASGARTLRRLESEMERVPVEARPHLLERIAAAYFENGERAEGLRLCHALRERAATDLAAARALLDLAVWGGDAALLADVTADVRHFEGEDGTWWRYGEAVHLLMATPPALEAARTLATDLARRRPEWSRVALLQAYLHEREGDAEAAAQAYLQAFRGGERQAGLPERLVSLLVEQGRPDEADEVIRLVRQQDRLSPELARLGAEIALRQRAHERASELARLAVPSDATDYPRLIWLGQVLTQAGEQDEGEELLRRAVRQRDDLAETWLALLAHQVKMKQIREAEDTRDEMRRRLPTEQTALASALASELLHQWNEADRHYRDALAGTPNDAIVLQRAARFYLRLNRGTQAEPLLRRLLEPLADAAESSQAWARRQLALLLAFRSAMEAALTLLQANPPSSASTLADRRALLMVRATRTEERRACLRQLEATTKIQPFAADELVYLVRLYEADGDEDTACERRLDLLIMERDNPECLAHHVERLLQRGRRDEARPWIVHLKKITAEYTEKKQKTNREGTK